MSNFHHQKKTVETFELGDFDTRFVKDTGYSSYDNKLRIILYNDENEYTIVLDSDAIERLQEELNS